MRGRRLRFVPLVAAAALALAGCGGDAAEEQPGAALVQDGPSTGHVHAVGVDPADGSIVVAAHSGLFRAEAGARRAEPTGDRRDAMGFTIEGPGRYLASGHPPLDSDEPPSVGLIRSDDAGRSWRPLSLSGEADLHVLEVAPGGRLYAFDAISSAFMASRDDGRTWRRTALPSVLDLAVDPGDPQTVVASTERGLLRSRDGGRGWRPAAGVPPSLLAWTGDGLVLLGLDGAVRRMATLDEAPQEIGRLPQRPSAVTAAGGSLLVATDDGAVMGSQDGGRTWRPRLGPAA